MELLAVIAVLALLASLLLPVLASTKAVAYRIKCTSNLRQLGLASYMYWEENEGRAFRYLEGSTNGGDIYWFGWLEKWNGGNEGYRKFDARLGTLFPYLQGRGVELCPALNYESNFKYKAAGASYGYGYNWHLSRPISQPAFAMNQLRDASSIALFADAAQVNTFQYPASPENPLLEEFYYIRAGERTAHFRHGGQANILYCDGHVGRDGPEPGSMDTTAPRHRTGSLRSGVFNIPRP